MTSSPSPRAALPGRLFNRRVITALVIAIAAGAGYWAWHKFYATPNPREQYLLATAQRGDLQDLVTATGTVQPRDYVDVGAQVSGQLKKLHIDVGSVVESGDLLAEIDPTVFRATVDARRAGLRNQQATMTERESQLTLMTLQYNRQKNLMAADATSIESLQQAEAALRAAKAQIEALKAQIDQTQSTLRADEANLNYAKIYAPMSGTVVSLTARQGQTLNANQSAPTILRIADLSTMTVQTQVSEAEVSKLRMGMEVYFTTLGSQGRRWNGVLRKVEPTPTVTNNVVLYNALFDVPNANQALMPSMTAQVFFIAASVRDALLVPTAGVTVARQGGNAGGGRRAHADGAKAPDAATAPKTAVPAKPAAAAPAAATPAPADPTAGMSREERRAAFEKMTPEERQARRERRNAQAPDATATPATAAAAAKTPAPTAADPLAGMSGDERRAAFEKMTPEQRQAYRERHGRVPRSSSGFADQSATPVERRGKVKVIDADGKIEERQVVLGVGNRVQTQILSGLTEGEQIVTGLKPPPGAQRARAPQGAGQQGGATGLPAGMGGQTPRGR